jgi:hypothetical protein
MSRPPGAWRHRAAGLLAEPTVRFFIIGALLFVAHRLVAGDPRVIVVTPGVKADLERRFKDHSGRAPTAAETAEQIRGWERDEALYREALRERLDRDDPNIRTILADRMRARAVLALPKREPSQADLDAQLAAHRSEYETPRRYDYETLSFPKSEPGAAEQRDRFDRAIKAGAKPSGLGRPVIGGNLTAVDLTERLGPELAARIQSLPVGQWQRLESADSLLLARVVGVEGGLLPPEELHRRLVADWLFTERQRAVTEAEAAIVARYRFEEDR